MEPFLLESLTDLNGCRAHFIGIKGTGMTALCEIFCRFGARVTGSDVAERFYTDDILARYGIRAKLFDRRNITDEIDLVVYSTAYNEENNAELALARERHLRTVSYPEVLGALSAVMYSAGIAGVHGKTTTSLLAGTLLRALPLPSVTLSGSASAATHSCVMISDAFDPAPRVRTFFAAETCEYQRHFMLFHPKKIVLTSVESDHEDYYPTFSSIQNAFVDYIKLLPAGGELIYCADDAGARDTARIARKSRPDIQFTPYGMTQAAEGGFLIGDVKTEGGAQIFSVRSPHLSLERCELGISGRHNVLNSAAALALCSSFLRASHLAPEDYAETLRLSLKDFRGASRRSEQVWRAVNRRGQEIIALDDYAHHPTAIRTTLEGYRDFYRGRRIIVDFMSHTYSRTRALLDDFARSFGAADTVILNDIYPSAREKAQDFNVTGEDLYNRTKQYHKNVFYEADFSRAARLIYTMLDDEDVPCVFVTMGAGDNFRIGQAVLALFNQGDA